MKHTILCLLITNIILLNTAWAEIEVNGFTIKPGILKKVAVHNYITYKETKQIPFTSPKDNPDFMFGYTIHRTDGRIFRHKMVLTMPAPLHASGHASIMRIPGGRVKIVHKEITNKDYGYFIIEFDEDDPAGLYQVEIYIDNKLLTIIDFDVKK